MDLAAQNPNTGAQQTVRLPDVLRFVIPAQHAVFILQALGEVALPYKQVQPVISNFEQQLLGQQLKPEYVGAPLVPIPPPAVDALRVGAAPSNDDILAAL